MAEFTPQAFVRVMGEVGRGGSSGVGSGGSADRAGAGRRAPPGKPQPEDTDGGGGQDGGGVSEPPTGKPSPDDPIAQDPGEPKEPPRGKPAPEEPSQEPPPGKPDPDPDRGPRRVEGADDPEPPKPPSGGNQTGQESDPKQDPKQDLPEQELAGSTDPRFDNELFEDPAQQEQIVGELEQRARQQLDDPEFELGLSDVEFERTDSGVRAFVQPTAFQDTATEEPTGVQLDPSGQRPTRFPDRELTSQQLTLVERQVREQFPEAQDVSIGLTDEGVVQAEVTAGTGERVEQRFQFDPVAGVVPDVAEAEVVGRDFGRQLEEAEDRARRAFPEAERVSISRDEETGEFIAEATLPSGEVQRQRLQFDRDPSEADVISTERVFAEAGEVEVSDDPVTTDSVESDISEAQQGLEETGSQESIFVEGDGGSRETTERALAKGLEEDLLERRPELAPEDVRVVREDGRLVAQLTGSGRAELARRDIAEQLDIDIEAVGAEVTETGRVVVGPKEDAVAEFESARRLVAAEDVILEEFPGAEGFSVRGVEDDLFEAEVTTEEGETVTRRFAFSDEAAESVQERLEAEARAKEESRLADIRESVQKTLERQVAARRAGITTSGGAGGLDFDALPDVELEEGEDIQFEETGSGVQVSLTDEFRGELTRETAATEFERALRMQGVDADLDPEEDIELEDGRAVLSESGQESIQPEERFDEFQIFAQRDVSEDPTAEDMGPLGLLDLRSREEREFERVRALDELAPLAETGVSISEDIGDLAALIPASPREQVAQQQALNEVLSERDLESESITDLSPSEALDITLETSERVQERSPAARFKAGAGTGVGAIATAPLTLPSAVVRGTEIGGAGVKETAAGRGEEFAGEVGEAATEIAVEAVEFAEKNPFRAGGLVAGSLAASAAAMGGAASLSARAGTASRFVIQPGEEIAGRGGAAAFSGTASGLGRTAKALPEGRTAGAVSRAARGAERTGEVLFPRGEPLIFSEEAAIHGTRVAVGRARRSLDAARSRISQVEGVNIQSRMGAGLVPPRIEIETESESGFEIDDDLQEALDAFERRHRRASRSSVDSETQQPSRDFEPFAETERAREEAGRQSLEEKLGRRRLESAVMEEQLLEEATERELDELAGIDSEIQQRIRPRTAVGVESVSEPAIETLQVQELEAMQETGLELFTETKLQTETLQELDVEQELELQLEAEQELELELELELEAETELRLETNLPDGPEGRPFDRGEDADVGLFSRQFEASVATSEEIIGSDIDAVGSDVEADSADAGKDLAADVADIDSDLDEVFDNDAF